MHTSTLAAGSWCWHDDYYAGRWSLLDQPAGAVTAGLTAIECNDFMLPPRLSRMRWPLLGCSTLWLHLTDKDHNTLGYVISQHVTQLRAATRQA